jgi:hypothetical protein
MPDNAHELMEAETDVQSWLPEDLIPQQHRTFKYTSNHENIMLTHVRMKHPEKWTLELDGKAPKKDYLLKASGSNDDGRAASTGKKPTLLYEFRYIM